MCKPLPSFRNETDAESRGPGPGVFFFFGFCWNDTGTIVGNCGDFLHI